MKIRKIALSILGVAVLGVAGWAALNWHALKHFPPIISSYYAKEMCSCLFVVGQTEATCHDIVRQYVPISEYRMDAVAKTVTIKGLGQTNTAHYVDERYGCVLEGAD